MRGHTAFTRYTGLMLQLIRNKEGKYNGSMRLTTFSEICNNGWTTLFLIPRYVMHNFGFGMIYKTGSH